MTPVEIVEFARQQYNAVGDSFFSDAELYRHLFQAQMILATKSNCIRNVYTASTVASTQEYSRPTNTIVIKRITYNGVKLAPITMREDDAITLSNSTTTATGDPSYYWEWGSSFFLRPVPAGVGTLKIYSIDKPQTVSSTSTIDVPDRYHYGLADYLTWRIVLKDRNAPLAREYKDVWEAFVLETIRHERKRLRGDAFYGIQDNESLAETVIGAI